MNAYDQQLIAYTGTTPGADASTYTLFDSTSANWVNGKMRQYGAHRLVLDIATIAAGTLKWSKSLDAGLSWVPMGSETLAATTVSGTATRDYLIEAAPDFRLRFVNGGSAQVSVLTGNVAMNGGGIPAAVANKTFVLVVGGTAYTIAFATPANETAILAAINAVLLTAATATVDGSHYLVITSAGLASIDAINAVAGTLALATIGFGTTSQAIGWVPSMALVSDRAPGA